MDGGEGLDLLAARGDGFRFDAVAHGGELEALASAAIAIDSSMALRRAEARRGGWRRRGQSCIAARGRVVGGVVRGVCSCGGAGEQGGVGEQRWRSARVEEDD